MSKIRTIYEVSMNKVCGSYYYDHFLAKKIILNSKNWSKGWSKKKASLVLSYDIDERSDIKNMPLLLKLLKKYDIKASFAAIGMLVESNPQIFRKVLADGHEIINHTYSHPNHDEFNPDKNFHLITQKERYEEIERCHKVMIEKLGYEMKGFRVPHFGYQFTEDIYPILKKLGYTFSSSTVAIYTKTAGFPYKDQTTKGLWELPMVCCPKHPYCIFDTSHAFRSRFAKHAPDEYLKTFSDLIDFGIQNNMFINLYQDPQDIRKFDYEEMLKIIASRKKDLFITTYDKLLHSAGMIR